MNREIEQNVRKYLGDSHKAVAYLATLNKTEDKTEKLMPELRPISLLEYNWQFFMITDEKSRKAQELRAHPLASLVIPLRDSNYSGYLRLCGITQFISKSDLEKRTGRLIKDWGCFEGPSLAYAEFSPTRVEFMAPGEDLATNITEEYKCFSLG